MSLTSKAVLLDTEWRKLIFLSKSYYSLPTIAEVTASTDHDICLLENIWKKFNVISIKIHILSSKKMHLKITSANVNHFVQVCLGSVY